MMIRTVAIFLSLSLANAFELPANSSQCLLGIASDWDSSHVKLQFFERQGSHWRAVTEKWDGRLGKKGLVWGLGLHPLPSDVVIKQEGDFRTPAGVFRIGGAWGYARIIRKHAEFPYHQVTSRDLWIEDPTSPLYNTHVLLPHEPRTSWEKQHQMKQNDPAHSLKLFIAHNAAPNIRAGAGSSIFFHIWRGEGSKPSAGCTTMAEKNLCMLISLINPEREPIYVILPLSEYTRLKSEWKLP